MDRPEKQTKIKYLSPSAYKLYNKDREEYYLRYLAPVRAPRFPQTKPMSIGSSFDGFIKNSLYQELVGDPTGTEYDLDRIIKAQCEAPVREWAREEGEWLFNEYVRSGAFASLLQEINGHLGPVQFEFTMQAPIKHNFKEVTLMGKPDLFFVNSENWPVILDFKVNGYCGSYNLSPKKGYLRLRDVSQSFGSHRKVFPFKFHGMMVNREHLLEDVDLDWAIQCAVYSWLSGEPVGKEVIVGIEQIACNGAKRDPRPYVRFAAHRTFISKAFQIQLYNAMVEAWDTINSDHFFRDLSPEDSIRKCARLDEQAQLLVSGNATEKLLAKMERKVVF